MKKKLTAVLILCLALCLCLTGCGNMTVKYSCGKSTAKIVCEKHAALMRCPHFEKSGSWINMKFNGKTWYSVAAVTAETAAKYADVPLAGQSSNLSVYVTDDPYSHYVYLMPLEGTDDAWIMFKTDQHPGQGSYGNDFDNCIKYYYKDIETVPDTRTLESFEEEPFMPDFVW